MWFDRDSMFRCVALSSLLAVCSGCQQMSLLQADPAAFSQPAQEATQQPGPYTTSGLSDHQSAAACLATAQEFENKGFDKEAIVTYERAMGFDPNQKGLAQPLARLYSKLGNKDKAIHYFQAALAERPGDPEILGDYGYFLFEQGDFATAEQQLREALKVQPANPRNQTNLALVLYSTQGVAESLNAYEMVVGQAAARFNVAMLLARDGRVTQSRMLVREALRFDPQLPQAKAFEAWLTKSNEMPGLRSPAANTGKAKLTL